MKSSSLSAALFCSKSASNLVPRYTVKPTLQILYTVKKGFVIPTKSFVEIGRDKKNYFVTTTKCLVLSTKRLVAAAKFLVAATKDLFVVPNFVAVTKPFFPGMTYN